MTQLLQSYFYHSQLAPEHDASCVSSIIKTARSFNAINGITGILIFDGERFCQYFEGPEPAVHDLYNRIQEDPRHTVITTILSGPLSGPRLFDRWAMGYCVGHDTPYIRTIQEKNPQEAVEYFHASRNTLDIA